MAIEDPDELPIDDALGAEEESPFRRRQKVVPVRRGRFVRVRRILRWVLVGALVLLPLGYVGYRLGVFGLASPRFVLTSADDIVVTGNHYVSREEVLNVLGFPTSGKLASGVNIFRLSLDAKKRQIETIPWVRSATISRAYPHRLAVSLVERTPVAFVNVEGRVKLVDGEGILLDKPEQAAFDFPVLTGLDAGGGITERQARLALYQEFSQAVAIEVAASGWLLSEVDLADRDDLKAVLVQGPESLQIHFGHEKFGERFHTLLFMLPQMQRGGTKIDSIDLRYRSQVVVNPQATDSREAGAQKPPAKQEE